VCRGVGSGGAGNFCARGWEGVYGDSWAYIVIMAFMAVLSLVRLKSSNEVVVGVLLVTLCLVLKSKQDTEWGMAGCEFRLDSMGIIMVLLSL